MDYVALKNVHMFLAAVSIGGFILRWTGLALNWRWVKEGAAKILPHIVDTLFLATGIALVFSVHQYPFVHGWLTAKIIGLVGYIVLGSFALKHGASARSRTAAFLLAIGVFAWIVSVARLKTPWGFLAGLG